MKRLLLLLLCFHVFFAWAGPYDDFVVNGIGYKIISQNPNRVKVNNNVNNTWLDNWSDMSLYVRTVSVAYMGVAVIPDTVEFNGQKYLVSEIGVASFRNSNVTEVHLPSSVHKINYFAFQNCHNLRKVYFPEGLDTISLYAFQHCDSLEDILLPNSLLYVGGAAFYDCPSVKQLNIGTELIYMAEDAFVLANNLQRISYNARNCHTEYLGNFDYPRNIGFSSDAYCRLDIGDSVRIIPENLFFRDNGLRGKVIIPSSVKYIAQSAFYRTGIDTLVFSMGLDSIGESAFQDCNNISVPIVLPASLKRVGPDAFYGNYSYSSPIVLPDGIEYIDEYAFQNSAMIGTITVPASVRYIGEESLPYDTLIIESDSIVLGRWAIDYDGVVYINSLNPPRLEPGLCSVPVYEGVDTICPFPEMPDFCWEEDHLSYWEDVDCQKSIDYGDDLYIFIPCGARSIYCQASPGWQYLCQKSDKNAQDFYDDYGYEGYSVDHVEDFRILEKGYRHEETIQVCGGYAWGSMGYITTSDVYTQTFTASDGCDSVVTLNLTILPAIHDVIIDTTCGSYTWHGTEYTESGNYVYHYSNGDCASADTLHLTIRRSTAGVDEQTACESYTWINGVTYTESTNTPTFTLTNAAGCDSVVTLHLTILRNSHVENYLTLKEIDLPYVYEDTVFDAGTPSQSSISFVYPAANGCDSIVTLHLTILSIPDGDAQPCPGVETLTDYDGNVYNTVKIGQQCWMKENLKTRHFADGAQVSNQTPYGTNDIATYGYLYNGVALLNGASPSSSNPSNLQGICPSGWHVPSDAEWTQLSDYVKSVPYYTCNGNNNSIAKALASAGDWNNYNNDSCAVGFDQSTNNVTGFSARPTTEYYMGQGRYAACACFWSATKSSESFPNILRNRRIYHNNAAFCEGTDWNDKFASVRCILDPGIDIPNVSTLDLTNITLTSAYGGGNVSFDDSADVIARGVCWNTTPNPTLFNPHTTDGGGTGPFTSIVTGLLPNTTYYLRAYASTSTGTTYGNEVVFTTMDENDSICSIAIEMHDNLGDGWNGNTIRVHNHGRVQEITLPSGDSGRVVVEVYNGLLQLEWLAGNKPAECSFVITGPCLYYESFGTPTPGVFINQNLECGGRDLIVDFTYDTTCTNGRVFCNFESTVSNAQSYWWEFGDGSSSTQNPVTHEYLSSGAYVVSLTVQDSMCSYPSSVHKSVAISIPVPAGDAQPCPGVETLTDYDGNVYNTVIIGHQCWMKEDLRTTHYADGTAIPSTTPDEMGYSPGYCDCESPYCYGCGYITNYGYHYNWYAVMHGASSSNANPSGVQGICPTGWHVPSDAEWTQLTNYVGSVPAYVCGMDSNNIAKSLATSVPYWNGYDNHCAMGNAPEWNNATGFSSIPMGVAEGSCWNQRWAVSYWSSSLFDEYRAWIRELNYDSPVVRRGYQHGTDGYPVRCVLDYDLTVITDWVYNVAVNSANCYSEVSSDNNVRILERGVCWSTSPNPTLDDAHTTDGSGSGDFTSTLTGLAPGTTYYVRAYATSIGTTYGNEVTFTTLPIVSTNAVSDITLSEAIGGGVVNYDVNSNIVARGVCWSESHNPTLNDNHTNDGSGVGSFTSAISGLQPGTTYYVRAYATTNTGTIYGNEVSFTTAVFPAGDALPCPGTPTVTDYDGNIYNTVKVGGQCWMKENLRTTHYSNGAPVLPLYAPNNDTSLVSSLGYFYTWNSVMNGSASSDAIPSGVQGICPVGWHLPSPHELYTLQTYAGNEPAHRCGNNTTNAAKALCDTAGWRYSGGTCHIGNEPNNNNSTGFSAYPAGGYNGSEYVDFGASARFWSTRLNGDLSLFYTLIYNARELHSSYVNDGYGCSVRCLRDVVTAHIENVTDVTYKSAVCTVEVIYHGYNTVTTRGICWSTSPNPTIAGSHTENGSGTGLFMAQMTLLDDSTTYYVRAYASTSDGVVYGNEVSFTTPLAGVRCPDEPTVTDVDGNVYNTVQIGIQCWMKENLRTTHYSSGELIPYGDERSITLPYRNYPNNDSSLVAVYGYLYNWPGMMNGSASSSRVPSNVQGACPDGWHVPSHSEWMTLINYSRSIDPNHDARPLSNVVGWDSSSNPNDVGGSPQENNSTGFSSLPAGAYDLGGYGGFFGCGADYWAATEDIYWNSSYAIHYGISCNRSYVYIYDNAPVTGLFRKDVCISVRCLRDVLCASISSEFFDTACESYTWQDSVYTQSGDYTQTFVNANGCDSVVTLHLTILHGTHNAISVSECDSYTWTSGTGATYTQSGTYIHHYTNADGCASADTLHLTIRRSTAGVDVQTACERYTWIDGVIYTESTNTPTFTLTNAAGCDSVVTLHLTIRRSTAGVDEQTACERYTWINGVTYTESTNTPTFTLTNAIGCDSVVTLHLTILHGTHNAITVSECDSYTWTSGTGVTYTQSGTYVHHYTNADGCASADTLHLTINPMPVVTVSVDDTLLCEGGMFTLTANAAPATVPCLYQWYRDDVLIPGATSSSYVALNEARVTAYHYTVSVTSNAGCITTAIAPPITVVDNPTVTVTRVSGYAAGVCDGGSTALQAVVVGGCGDNFFQWYKNGNLLPDGNVQTLNVPVLHYGVNDLYTVMVTQTGPGCFSSASENISTLVQVLPVDTVDVTEYVCGSYTWNNTTYTSSGDYTKTLTNANGCDSVVTLHLTILHGTHNAITVSECDSYTWVSGTGATYTQSGTYEHHYTNADGCASADTLHLTINPLPVVTVSVDDTLVCEGGMVTLTANVAPATVPCIYQWYRDGALLPGVTSSSYVVVNEARVTAYHYTVSVTSNAGCGATASAPDIRVMNTPTVTVTREAGYPATVCEGGSTVLTANVVGGSGINAYQWYRKMNGGEAVAVSGANASSYTTSNLLMAGSYDYYVSVSSNISGCSVTSSAVTSNVVSDPSVSIQGGDRVCEDGNLRLNVFVSGGVEGADYVYGWGWTGAATGCQVTSSPFFVVNGFSPDNANPYYFTVTLSRNDNTGCDATSAVHLVNVLAKSVVSITETSCGSYTWNNTTYTSSGDYTKTLTNANGCDSVVTLHLTILHGTHNAITVSECGSYTWHGQTYTQSGIYVHHYTNADGCASADTLHLTIRPLPTVAIMGTTTVCEGYTTQLTASGGSSYVWSNAATTNSITVGQSGVYFVTATNVEGCSAVTSALVTVNPNPQISITGNTTICAGSSTTLTATGASNYIWSTGAQTASLQVNAFGMYSVTGTSSEGCVGSADVVVLVSPQPVITIAGDTNICQGESTTLVAQGGVLYIWSNGSTDSSMLVDASGNFQVMGFSEAGCYAMANVSVHVWNPDVSEETVSVSDSCYIWNGESYCQSGDYVQTLQNIHGCDSVVTLHLTVSVGIESYGDDYSIRAYPNPTNSVITLEVDNPMVELTEAALYNAMGQQIRKSRWGAGDQLHQIDMSDLGHGMYFVRLYSHGHYIGFVKVVKQ